MRGAGDDAGHDAGAGADGDSSRCAGELYGRAAEVDNDAFTGLNHVDHHAERFTAVETAQDAFRGLVGRNDVHAEVAAQALDEPVHRRVVEGLSDRVWRVAVGSQGAGAKLSLAEVKRDEQAASAGLKRLVEMTPVVKLNAIAERIFAQRRQLIEVDDVASKVAKDTAGSGRRRLRPDDALQVLLHDASPPPHREVAEVCDGVGEGIPERSGDISAEEDAGPGYPVSHEPARVTPGSAHWEQVCRVWRLCACPSDSQKGWLARTRPSNSAWSSGVAATKSESELTVQVWPAMSVTVAPAS